MGILFRYLPDFWARKEWAKMEANSLEGIQAVAAFLVPQQVHVDMECTSTVAFLCTPCPKEQKIFRFNSREWKASKQSRLGSYSLCPSNPCMGDGMIPWVWVPWERWRNHHLHDA